MSNLIIALSNLSKFEEHDLGDPIGKIKIKKPDLADAERMEEIANSNGEGIEQIKEMAREIGLKFIVDAECNPELNEDNIDALLSAPLEVLMDIINAFTATFQRANAKSEELKKKR